MGAQVTSHVYRKTSDFDRFDERCMGLKATKTGCQYVTAAFYLAALPAYRQACFDVLLKSFPGAIGVYICDTLLDSSVKSGVNLPGLRKLRMRRILGGRAYVQSGYFFDALSCDVLVVDLNPRSLTSWVLLIARRALGRRTLVWGHLHPRAGSQARTAILRRFMRRLSSGTITYTFSHMREALEALPNQPVWCATNAIYHEADIKPAVLPEGAQRTDIIYVGRFEPAKKVDHLVDAFAHVLKARPSLRLRLVGGGSQEASLRQQVAALGIEKHVIFEGWVDNADDLRRLYETAICSVSPGFAGLSLTQSLGFGIPMVVARSEQHAPEIELAGIGGVVWVESDDASSMASGILTTWENRDQLPDLKTSEHVRTQYSAEKMAKGLRDALLNVT